MAFTNREPSRGKRKGRLLFFSLAVMGISGFLFRHSLMVFGAELAIRAMLSGEAASLDYEKIGWENNRIVLSGAHFKTGGFQLNVDKMEIGYALDLGHLYFEPHVFLSHPEVTLIKGGSSSGNLAALGLLSPTKRFGLKMDIQNGVLQLDEESRSQRLYFRFNSGDESHEIGTFALSYDPALLATPVLAIQLGKKNEELTSFIQLQSASCDQMIQMASFFYPEAKEGWENIQGELDIAAEAVFSTSLSLDRLNCQLDFKNLSLNNPKFGIQAKTENFHGDFSYPADFIADGQENNKGAQPIWKKVFATAYLQQGELKITDIKSKKQWAVTDAETYLMLDPKKDPSFYLKGALINQDKQYPFNLDGKGYVHEDESFWLELSMELSQPETEAMTGFLSVCSSEKDDYVLQGDFKNLGMGQVQLFKEIIALSQPSIANWDIASQQTDGKMTAWVHKKQLRKLVLEEIAARDVQVYTPEQNAIASIEELKGEATFEANVPGSWSVTHLNTEAFKGSVACEYNGKNVTVASHVDMHLVVQDALMQLSWIKGNVLGLDSHVVFNGSGADCDAHLKVSTSVDKLINLLTDHENKEISLAQPVLISAAIKKDGPLLELLGNAHLELPDGSYEKIEFGCDTNPFSFMKTSTSLTKTPRPKGWFRSEKITSSLYLPFLKLFGQDMECSGDLDLFGTFDEKDLQVSIQASQVEFVHPLGHFSCPAIGEKDAQLLKNIGRARFVYDWSRKLWEGEIPIQKAAIELKPKELQFQEVSAQIKVEGNQWRVENLNAQSEGLSIKGRMGLSPSGSDGYDFFFIGSEIQGPIAPIIKFCGASPYLLNSKNPISGVVYCGAEQLQMKACFNGASSSFEWIVHGKVAQTGLAVADDCDLKNLSFDFDLNSKQQLLVLSRVFGEVYLPGRPVLELGARDLKFNFNQPLQCQFDLHLKDKQQEMARMQGIAQAYLPSEVHFTFDPEATHLNGTKLNITQLVVKEGFKIAQLKMRPAIPLQEVAAQMEFFANWRQLPNIKPLLAKWADLQAAGNIELKLDCTDHFQNMHLEAKSDALLVNGLPAQDFALSLYKDRDHWLLENLQAGGLRLKTDLIVQKNQIQIPSLILTGDHVGLKMEGVFDTDQNKFKGNLSGMKMDLKQFQKWLQLDALNRFCGSVKSHGHFQMQFSSIDDPCKIDGDLNFLVDAVGPDDLTVQNEGFFNFSYSAQEGWRAKELNVQTSGQYKEKFSGFVACDELGMQSFGSEANIKAMRFNFSPELMRSFTQSGILPAFFKKLKWENALEGKLHYATHAGVPQAKVHLKDGYYWWDESAWDLKQIVFDFQTDKWGCSFSTAHQKMPLLVNCSADLKNTHRLIVSLKENLKRPGLKVILDCPVDKDPVLQSIQGYLYGMDCNLIRNVEASRQSSTALAGNIKFNLAELSCLLSKKAKEKLNSFKLGKGYELSGNLFIHPEEEDLFHFKGKMSGRNFDLMGFTFQSMEALADIRPERILIQNLSFEDDAGFLSVKQIKLNKNPIDAIWRIDVPLLQIEDLRPSALKKPGEMQKPIKPMIIKHLSLTHLQGALNDVASLTASGHLDFTNAFKKEYGLFDLPLEMIKNIGLDPGLFTPVYGEIEYQLENGKFYLMQVHNTYSDGRRSQFYLADDTPCFVDLEGRIKVDIRMKQNVVLNFADSLVLTIRGTLDKPKYGLQR